MLPFPSGWYCLGLSSELPRKQILSRRFVGHDVVVFRTAGGSVSVMDAYCPHLGSHLGQGTIEGEAIQCSFHHFRFDCAGQCVATGYGGRTPSIAVQTWPVEEKNGLILAYHGSGAPGWSVPSLEGRWTPMMTRVWRQPGHPQETTENSLDLLHFARLHGFVDVEEIRGVDTAGPRLTAKYRMRKPMTIFGGVPFELEVSAHGLGYSVLETWLPSSKVRLRHFILACPTEANEIELRIALCMERHRLPLADQIVPRIAFRSWHAKRHVARPVAGEDGTFRRWAEQFYSRAAG